MKATFFERVGAYLLDTIILSLIFSVICFGIGDNTKTEELLLEELDNKLLQSEITTKEYFDEYMDIMYDYQKETILTSGISLALTVAYFVVFQYMNKGQTLGKKLLKIQVVDKETKKPITILKGLLRTFIITSALSGTISLITLYLLKQNIYYTIYGTFLGIETIFVLITVILVLYKKDGRGLHDMMSNTIVIKESR
ncbi:MAG: RDD family protein [Bacilli bacterium]|nr:RDD family protein [Bacilli bacterium]